MSTELNKSAIRRLFEDVWNERNLDAADDVLVPAYAERERNWAETVLAAFPDTHFTIEDMLAEGDRVATRVVWRATHQGQFDGIVPTGKHVAIPFIFIHVMEQGKAVESWGYGGKYSIFDQIKSAITSD